MPDARTGACFDTTELPSGKKARFKRWLKALYRVSDLPLAEKARVEGGKKGATAADLEGSF